MTAAVLAGRSLHRPRTQRHGAADQHGQAVDAATGQDVLIRRRNAGLIHHGQADDRTESRDGRPDFQIVGKAEWDPNVSEDEWRAVHSLLVDPSRRTNVVDEPK